ncbi:MAG: FMN-binding negative transcriptional regulator [Gemmatimonadaceae bacterium]
MQSHIVCKLPPKTSRLREHRVHPSRLRRNPPQVLLDSIESRSFGTRVTHSPESGLLISHVPFILRRSEGSCGMLEGHRARANEHAAALIEKQFAATVIFHGPDAYITPTWYESKQRHGKVVPTWEYVAVHATGTASGATSNAMADVVEAAGLVQGVRK